MLLFIAGLLLNSDNSRTITVSVSLDKPVQPFSQDWPVYVFAAAPGTKLPLSSYTTRISELPNKVILTEDMYLLPTHTIADQPEVVVTVKVSSSGDPHQKGPEDVSVSSPALSFHKQSSHQLGLTIKR
ncbi:c-type cytochrome biogenesis protein CcmI/CycH [Amphritea sp. HPY]|uniref:c-type cytochrome biogenesis protein CcmI/CycH n=1 Tax=Amphritea sp. HPY TaxID=3421652 RepID=UPI003D7C6734